MLTTEIKVNNYSVGMIKAVNVGKEITAFDENASAYHVHYFNYEKNEVKEFFVEHKPEKGMAQLLILILEVLSKRKML
jgi:hypothetical protein